MIPYNTSLHKSHNLVALFVDNFHHQFIDPLHHAFIIALESGLNAGIIEQLSHYQARLICIILPVLVESHHQFVGLVELEGDIPEFHPGLAGLGLLLHHGLHEGHLAHA